MKDKTRTRLLHFKISKDEEGYQAECVEFCSLGTEGKTEEELFENIEELIDVFLEKTPENCDECRPHWTLQRLQRREWTECIEFICSR